MAKEFTMQIEKDFDFIIEEGQNTSINLRKIGWNGRPAKLDLRKWNYQDGEERAGKGITLTDNGASELTAVLVEQGYGDTKRLAKALKTRGEDVGINTDVNDFDDDDGSEDYYDPSELLG